jgi:hypothetical protein
VTTWNRSRGRPQASHSSLARSVTSGVISDGFTTTALPAMSAMTASPVGIENGKFHGAMTPTTPRGV